MIAKNQKNSHKDMTTPFLPW